MTGRTRMYLFDWNALTKEFVKGPFRTVREYIAWSEERRTKYEENRPKRDAIVKRSAKMGWPMLKLRKDDRMVQNIVDGAVDQVTKKQIEELANSKTLLNQALLKILVSVANKPEGIQMKADVSDLVNDLKRSFGMRTKEEDQQAPTINLNQGVNVAQDSFRKRLERNPDEVGKISSGKTLDEIVGSVPSEQLEFVDKGDK